MIRQKGSGCVPPVGELLGLVSTMNASVNQHLDSEY